MGNDNPGKIVTFYSFKGGVGRTMALANVAFIAAMNNMRVLVMDWDLEAPGLSYYFRGLLEPQQAKTVKEAKGILNIFSEWVQTVRKGEPKHITKAFDGFIEGRSFRDCVVSLVPLERLPEGAALDYISAGSKKIQAANVISYEEALANFSWQNFFDSFVGGALLEGLRTWCKKEYDLILIDSRTGLADVAGICTMQLPDEVMLCFAFNRQNIDGVSRIAFAIRHNREEKVRLRAIPMRTSRVGTSEESDARARALSDLSRIGGFSLEALQEDFKLAVRATEGVPFYETLAPLLPKTPEIEVFSANYRQLASEIANRELSLPELPPDWKDAVRRRMQPRNATIEYIVELENAEPMRAAEELDRLLESALEEALDGNAPADAYVRALTEAAFMLPLELGSEAGVNGVAEKALDLLRALFAADKSTWSASLVDGIERYWLNAAYHLDSEQQVALLDEADSILAETSTLAAKIRRLDLRRSSVRIHVNAGHLEVAAQQMKDAWNLYRSIKQDHEFAGDQLETIFIIEADMHRLEGEMKVRMQKEDDALTSFKAGLKALDRAPIDGSRLEALRHRALLHSRLSNLLLDRDAVDDAARHAVMAADYASRVRNMIGSLFSVLATPVIARQSPDTAVEFCTYALLRDPRMSSSIAAYNNRTPVMVLDLVRKVTELARLVNNGSPDATGLLDALSAVAMTSLSALGKRRNFVSTKHLNELVAAVRAMAEALSPAGPATGQWESILRSLQRNPPAALQDPRGS